MHSYYCQETKQWKNHPCIHKACRHMGYKKVLVKVKANADSQK